MPVEGIIGGAPGGATVPPVHGFPTPAALIAVSDTNSDEQLRVSLVFRPPPVKFHFFFQPDMEKGRVIDDTQHWPPLRTFFPEEQSRIAKVFDDDFFPPRCYLRHGTIPHQVIGSVSRRDAHQIDKNTLCLVLQQMVPVAHLKEPYHQRVSGERVASPKPHVPLPSLTNKRAQCK